MTEAASQNDPLVGTVIADRYRVDAKVGDGGMGAVYRVEHTHMRKRLALKVLHRDLCAYPEIVARFEREAMAAANIEHPNVANATDFGKLPDGSFYLVLEYVEGIDLRQLLQRDKFLTPARAVHIALQILGALGRAHDLGIVHRDLKPENILLVEKDNDPEYVKVLDFGIARVPVGALGTPSRSGSVGEAKPLTKAGTVYGTPEYMAPEQALGHQVDGRADLYALGVLLFEMLAGSRPYDDADKIALLGAHVSKAIPRLSSRVPKSQFVTDGLEAVVTKALAKQPEDRYGTAREFADALFDLGFDAPMPITRHPSQSGAERSGAYPAGPESRPSTRIPLSNIEVDSPRPPAAIDTSPAMQPTPTPVPQRSSKLPWFIALLSVVGAAGAVYYLKLNPGTQPQPATSTTASPVASNTVAPSVSTAAVTTAPDLKEQALTALGRVASGEIEAGVKVLEELAAAHPADPTVLRALAQAYSRAKRPIDAISTVKKLVTASPEGASDPLLVPIIEEGLADSKADGETIALLTGAMGNAGARLLYETAYNDKALAAARARANRALRDAKTNKLLPPAIRAVYELRTASACPARKSALDKHKKVFDETAIPVLHAMQKPTCGANGKQSCWPCIYPKEIELVLKDIESKKK